MLEKASGYRKYTDMKKEAGKPAVRERYEKMLAAKEKVYFETEEIEAIADSYENEMAVRKALQVVSYGLDLYPGNEALLLRKAQYLLSLDRIEEAGRTLDVITDHGIDYLFVKGEVELLRGNDRVALAAFQAIIEDDDCQLEDCIEIIDIAFDDNRQDIIDVLMPAMKEHIDDMTPLYREIAFSCDERHDTENAVKWYNKLLDINPYSTDDWAELAKAYVRLHRFKDAIEACDFALAIDDKDENLLSYKGFCYLFAGRSREAIKQFEEFGAVTSDKSVAYEYIAQVYINDDMEELAIIFLQKAIEENEHNGNAYYKLAVCYYDLGDNKAAIDTLRKSLSYNDGDIMSNIFLGELLTYENEYEEAYEHLSPFSHAAVFDEVAAVALASACLSLERYDEVIKLLEQFMVKFPYTPDLYWCMILACIYSGRLDEASAWMQRVGELVNDAKAEKRYDKETLDKWKKIERDLDGLRSTIDEFMKQNRETDKL